METDATYFDLISKYLAGEASQPDMELLRQWLKADTANQLVFKQQREAWMLSEARFADEKYDAETAFAQVKQKIQDTHKTVPLRPVGQIGFYLRAAAAVAIIGVVAAALYFYFSKPLERRLVAVNNTELQTLSDGSLVSLNAGSSLTYPETFEGNLRQVELDGEAYFEVSRNTQQPFLISYGSLRIEVLGTSFYVDTKNSEGNAEVALFTGKVAVFFEDNPSQRVILFPGEKATIYMSNGRIIKNENKDANCISWKTKKMSFDNAPLKQIADDLERTYHTRVVIKNPALLDCRVTATFEGQSLDAVLNVLKATLNLNIKKNAGTVEINGRSCK